MEALYYDPRIQKRVEAIELLNDWGYRIVEITGTLYIVEEFIPAGEDGATVTELVGQNVTKWIHNQTQTTGLTKQQQGQLQQMLNELSIRRRRFSSNTTWYEYLSASAHNV